MSLPKLSLARKIKGSVLLLILMSGTLMLGNFFNAFENTESTIYGGIKKRDEETNHVETQSKANNTPSATLNHPNPTTMLESTTAIDVNYKVGLDGHIIISQARHEVKFMLEWINYNIWIGFDHIVIFNNEDNLTELHSLLNPYVIQGVVTIINWEIGNQLGAYNHGMKLFAVVAKSITFLDIDEFIVLCQHTSIGDLYEASGLLGIGDNKSEGPKCVELYWYMFGTSYLPILPKGASVLQSFSLRHVKPAIVHAGKIALRGGIVQSQEGNGAFHFCNKWLGPSTKLDVKQIHINHYSMKHGEASMKARVDRGFAGDKKMQKMYLTTPLQAFESRNEHLDVTLLHIRKVFPQILEVIPNLKDQKRGNKTLPCL